MVEAQKRSEELLNAALEATSGMAVEGLFRAERPYMSGLVETPWRQRPWVLRDSRVRRAPLRKVFAIALRALTLDWPNSKIRFTPDEVAAQERANRENNSRKRVNKTSDEQLDYYFGPAQSLAAGLLVASLPRSKARVLSLLCVTRDELMLLHVPDTYRSKYFANAVDVGWRINRSELEWTRISSGTEKLPGVQYGFTDGSWMTLYTEPVDGHPAFTDIFPFSLAKEDAIPPHDNYPEPEPKK